MADILAIQSAQLRSFDCRSAASSTAQLAVNPHTPLTHLSLTDDDSVLTDEHYSTTSLTPRNTNALNMSRISSNGVDLVLQLKDALPADTVHSIATSLSRVPGCNVSNIPVNGSGVCFKASVQVPSLQGVQHVRPHSAEAVLQATAWLEHNAQV